FLKCDATLQELHSFPTRRSSDLRKNLVIKMPDGVPPAVQESFAALIPALLVMILVLIVRIVFENTHYHTIHQFIYDVVATPVRQDRKSTRLNSSHVKISYAVFCL